MLDVLLALLVVFLIFCLVSWVVHTLAGTFTVPKPIVTVLDVLLVVLFVWYALGRLGIVSRLQL